MNKKRNKDSDKEVSQKLGRDTHRVLLGYKMSRHLMTPNDDDRTPETQLRGPSVPSFDRPVQHRCCRQPRASAVRLPRTSLVGSGEQKWPWAGAQSGCGFPDFQAWHSHSSRGSPPLPLSKAC